MYVKWMCVHCKDVKISNSHRHHEMNICKCGRSGLDLEESYARLMGGYKMIEEYDYNFFEETLLNMREQGLFKQTMNPNVLKISGDTYLDYAQLLQIREIEDYILGSIL